MGNSFLMKVIFAPLRAFVIYGDIISPLFLNSQPGCFECFDYLIKAGDRVDFVFLFV